MTKNTFGKKKTIDAEPKKYYAWTADLSKKTLGEQPSEDKETKSAIFMRRARGREFAARKEFGVFRFRDEANIKDHCGHALGFDAGSR